MLGTGVEGCTVVLIGLTGFSGLSILVGSVAFRVHVVDRSNHELGMGSEYGVEHVVILCSTDDP